nr:putative mitochondrial protein [Tanacetum cinerariifolium]
MYCLEVIASDEMIDEDQDNVLAEQEMVSVIENKEDIMPQISLNALTGILVMELVKNKCVMAGTKITSMDICVYQVSLMQMIRVISQQKTQIQTLIIDHAIVFETSKELPPKRSHDHTIPLFLDTLLISIIPYKHPPNQKDATLLMVKVLLEVTIIRNSQSLFSSPIVMVKKKDGTWRMRIDYKQLKKHTMKDKFLVLVIEELINELNGDKVFLKLDLRNKRKIMVGNDEHLRTKVVQHFHTAVVGSHSSANVTAHKIGTLFYWKGMHKMVKKLIRECDTCQRQKVDLFAYLGHLHPLPIHEKVWSDISMDFIVGLLKSQGKTVISVVVDKLRKYAHFMAHTHPYTTSLVAQVVTPDNFWIFK